MKSFVQILICVLLLGSGQNVVAQFDQNWSKARLDLEQQVLVSPSASLQEIQLKLKNQTLDPEQQLFLLTLQARIEFFKGEMSAAKSSFAKADALQKSFALSWSHGYFFMYRSYFAIEEGSLDSARQFIKQARSTFVALKDSEQLIRVAALEGVVLIWREEYPEALKVLQDAHAFIMRNQVSETTQLTLYDALTAYYATMKYFDKGLEFALLAANFAKQNSNILDGLPAKYNLCLVYLRSEKLNETEQCYLEMAEVAQQFSLPRYQFWAPSGLGKVALAREQWHEALDYFAQAQENEFSAIINPAHLIVLRNNQARALMAINNQAAALGKIKESLAIIKDYHSPLNNRYLRQTLKLQAEILVGGKNYQSAVKVLSDYIALIEESERETKAILEQEAKSFYGAEQHRLQLALADQKLEAQAAHVKELQQQKSLMIAYVLVFLATVFCGLLFWYFQGQFKANKLKYYSKDPLTGLFNRLYLHDQLEKLIYSHAHFSIVTLDLTRFKAINDRFGYQVGDEIIREFAKALKESFREDRDIIVRSGGEEFVILYCTESHNNLPSRLEAVKQRLNERITRLVDVEVQFDSQVLEYNQQGLATLLVQIDNALRG
ncbi:diguanylate cyclase domain-containing protein [Pseudoalteromonas fenneropenaei]|uniref:diguanylate cyclase n=1 Tax=Pseudoalteromonas fenneropenaei TaxID=1737459 RepID=A0ABV7CHP7_9GAMM